MNPIHTGQGSTSSQVGSSGSAWESKRSIMPQIAIPSIAGVGRRTPVGGPPLSLADLGNLRERQHKPGEASFYYFDPQDKLYNAEKLYKLMEYFSESTEHGRLYLNYPMVESFCHIRSFPDPGYGDRQVRMEELEQGKYKARVDRESCLTDIRKYDKGHMSEVIYMNLEKLRQRFFEDNLSDDLYTPLRMTLRKQNQLLAGSDWFYVLNTCVLFVYEYNSSLLK